jgi:hypothetical protein
MTVPRRVPVAPDSIGAMWEPGPILDMERSQAPRYSICNILAKFLGTKSRIKSSSAGSHPQAENSNPRNRVSAHAAKRWPSSALAEGKLYEYADARCWPVSPANGYYQ